MTADKQKKITRKAFFNLLELGAAVQFTIPLGKSLAANSYQTREYPEQIYSLNELAIGDYCATLMLSLDQLSFDAKGNLLLHKAKLFSPEGRLNPPSAVLGAVNVKPTDFNLAHQTDGYKVSDVSLLVLHSDDGRRVAESGKIRTSITTLNGMNDDRKVSVHFCVDELPISLEGRVDETEGYYPGYGILATQLPSGEVNQPYRAKHVSIATEDHARQLTLPLFRQLGIDSNFIDLADKSDFRLDNHTLGFEMVGLHYDYDFPNNWPPISQVSNAISLTLAIANQYGLSPWDIIGHHEVQEKTDPGDLFMLLARYCLGIAGLTGALSYRQIFADSPPQSYFSTLEDYFQARPSRPGYDSAIAKLGINFNPVPCQDYRDPRRIAI